MNETTTCPECGATLPSDSPMGLCPACVFGLADGDETLRENPEKTGVSSVRNVDQDRELRGEIGDSSGREQSRLFQDYELLGEIARGGMGVVYRARQLSLNREVALKMILGGRLASEEEVSRFRAEAEAAAGLQHANIVAIHEVGEHAGQHFFSMDYVPGCNLAELARREPLPPEKAACYVRRIAEAVHYAHGQGIVHRDLKPQNILIDSSDEPRITDFGVAKQTQSESALTLTGVVLGSPSYMAPEQAQGRQSEVGPRSDVYSIGAILYELLTGRPPFRAASPAETLRQVVESEAATPRTLNSSIPEDVETICLKCLEKDPSTRYATAQAVAYELGRYLGHEPIHARPATVKERAVKWGKRNPKIAALWGIVALTALTGFLGVFIQLQKTKEALRQANLNALAEATARAPELSPKLTMHHDGEVLTAAFDQEGHRVLSASHDKTATVWDASEGTKLVELEGHEGVVGGAVFSPDETKILTFSFDTQSRFPNLTPVGERRVTSRIPIFSDQSARVWDAESGEQLIALDHPDQVVDAVFSADGKLIATAGWDHAARIWNTVTGEEIQALHGHTASILSVQFGPDGKRLVTGSSGYDYDMDIGPNGGGGGTSTIHEHHMAKLWAVNTGSEVGKLKNRVASVLEAVLGGGGYGASRCRVSFSPDGKYLVTAAKRPESTAVWSAEDGSLVASLKGHTYEVNSAAFSHDGSRVVTASADHTARIWDTRSGKETAVLIAHSGPVLWAEFSPNDQRVVTASSDTTVRVWDAATGRGLAVLKGHEDKVYQARFGPDNLRVVSASADSTVRIWDAATMDQLSIKLKGHREKLTRLAFSPDSQKVVTGSRDKTARVWETSTGAELLVLKGHSDLKESLRDDILGRVNGVAFSPDGQRIVTGAEDEHRLLAKGIKNDEPIIDGDIPFTPARIWDANDGTELLGLSGHECGVGGVSFSPDGSLVLTSSDGDVQETVIARRFLRWIFRGGSSDKKDPTNVRLWNPQSGEQVHMLGGHSGAIHLAEFSPDGKLIVTADRTSPLKVWNIESGELQTEFEEMGRVMQAEFAPDSRRLLINRARPEIWDAYTGKKIVSVEHHPLATHYAAFGPKGDRIICCMQDGFVFIFDAVTGKTEVRISQPTSYSPFAAVSPDGRIIATFANDKVARIWDAESGSAIDVLEGHTERITYATFSPDGKWLGTVSEDFTARLWPVGAFARQ